MSIKREQWVKRMRAWERSGQTRAAFCRSRGLNLHTFDYWRRALREASTALVPVVVETQQSAAPSTVIEVLLPDGVRVRVPSGCEAAQVASLVSALRMVQHGNSSEGAVAQVLQECLDDLRLTIDSLEPAQTDLALLLATLRFRLGPRLQAAGLAIDWRVGPLPPVSWLTSPAALHVLRILQEG